MKPKTKKLIYRISFIGMIAAWVAFLAAVRYSYMTDTESASEICIGLALIFTCLCIIFRRCKSEWQDTDSNSNKSNS